MLEKPNLEFERIIACLQEAYELNIVALSFLPLGADQNTAVYRAVGDDETAYFVKLRRGDLDEICVALPRFLVDQGIEHIIPPLPTKTGQLWANVAAFKVILYPFVEGRNAYEVDLTDRHWRALGQALKRIHSLQLPPAIWGRVAPETFSSKWRMSVKAFLGQIERNSYDEPVAARLAAFLEIRRDVVLDLMGRAERLAAALATRPPEFVLCHSDIHAGNVLIEETGALYIVDWDNPVLAPKERDLMYPGGGQFANRRTADEEERLFYQGYGQTPIDPVALAYYRYERIIEDIAAYCDQLFMSAEGGADREQSLRYLMSNFLPNNTIEIAYRSDRTG